MDQQGEQIHLSEEEASGGSKPAIARYVLAISLLLAVIAMATIWFFGVARAPQGDHGAAVSNQAAPTTAAQ